MEPKGGIEPPTPFLPRTCSASELLGRRCGRGLPPPCWGRQPAWPWRMEWWRGQDSNLRSPSGRQIYSLVALTTHPPLHAGGTNRVPDRCVAEPQRGLEPLACRLQVDCANRLRHWGALLPGGHPRMAPPRRFRRRQGSPATPDAAPASSGAFRFCRRLPYRLRRKRHIVNTHFPSFFQKSHRRAARCRAAPDFRLAPG